MRSDLIVMMAILFSSQTPQVASAVTPLAWFPLDGDAVDITGNGFDGVVVGASPATDRFGEESRALSFDGVNDKVVTGLNMPDYFDAQDPVTFSLWFRSSVPTGAIIAGDQPGSGPAFAATLLGGQVRARLYGNEPGVSDSVLHDGLWHHLAWGTDGGATFYYVDGLLQSELPVMGSTSSDVLTIGVVRASDNYYTGEVDDLRVYSQGLSEEEVLALYTDSVGSYAAIGDSYSSGEGAGRYSGSTSIHGVNECHRSEIAWPGDSPGGRDNLALPGFGAFTRNSVACSGALLSDLENDNHEGNQGEGPQLERIGDPDVVTVTIGGNDAFFADIIFICLAVNAPSCQDWEGWGEGNGTLRDIIADRIAVLESGELTLAYTAIRTQAHNATVFVAGYPRVFPAQGLTDEFLCPSLLIDVAEAFWLSEVADDLNEAIKCSAEEAGVRFVPLVEHFEGHESCAEDQDWINGFRARLSESFHPNKRGQREYARQVGIYSALLGNPEPQPGACGVVEGQATKPLATLDRLEVAGDFAPECGQVEGGYAAGQVVTVVGAGFIQDGTVDVEIHYEDGSFESLGSATVDSNGMLDYETNIPLGAPAEGRAMVLARGSGEDTAPRLLTDTIPLAASLTDDTDEDSIPDNCDNCLATPNEGQVDTDGDGAGDACDTCPLDSENDLDDDGVCDDIDECVDTEQLELLDEIISVGRTESACTVVSAMRYEITASGAVTFIAGQTIEIGDGFVVESGGRFTAIIGFP